ncbi:FkbM family methyltransferase [Frigoriflavimonas asaccharolytica]|uniref:FkbM family methyltransferase n=1 Tax=Frigoriflavimonas asaccharolytica TaxID=2735899 RepID=A0A8J8G7D5_9FLAO|nr:FkbM family methyltransferase [Frigoriflavimonas asaccharolytica]NRS92666.1 FkbM family methyltransferase [Frigoriflavimonas asaccharolytica]
MNVLKSLSSIIFDEGIINYVKRKKDIYNLQNHQLLYPIRYNNQITKIYLQEKFGYVDLYIFKFGIYEKYIIDDIRATLTHEKILLDIGGNIGQHSLLLAPYCKQIYAFEPIPAVYQSFEKSIHANNYKNITLQNTAIGSKKEVKTFNFVSDNAGASSFSEVKGRETTSLQVKIDTLKNVLPENITFDVVKMDVEGHEAVVILGNKEIFIKNKPIFFMEFSPSSIEAEGTHDPKELVNFFFENNYEIYSQNLNQSFYEDRPELYQNDNWILRPQKK